MGCFGFDDPFFHPLSVVSAVFINFSGIEFIGCANFTTKYYHHIFEIVLITTRGHGFY